MSSSKAKIKLEDSFKIIALLDIDTEINVKTKKVIKDAGLPMQCNPKLDLVSYTGHICPFWPL